MFNVQVKSIYCVVIPWIGLGYYSRTYLVFVVLSLCKQRYTRFVRNEIITIMTWPTATGFSQVTTDLNDVTQNTNSCEKNDKNGTNHLFIYSYLRVPFLQIYT